MTMLVPEDVSQTAGSEGSKQEAQPRGRLASTLLVLMLLCPVLNVFAVQQSDSLFADFASNGVQALAAILGAYFYLRAEYHTIHEGSRERWAWWLLSLGTCANALAATVYLLMVWFELPKFPSPADFFLLGFGGLSAAGLWILPRQRLPRWQVSALLLGVTCAATLVLLLLWRLLGEEMMGFYGQAQPSKRTLAMIYQAMDLLLVGSSLWALLRRDREQVPFWPLALLCAAFLMLAFADTLQVLFMANRVRIYRIVVEHAWGLVSVLLGLSGFLRPRKVPASEFLAEGL